MKSPGKLSPAFVRVLMTQESKLCAVMMHNAIQGSYLELNTLYYTVYYTHFEILAICRIGSQDCDLLTTESHQFLALSRILFRAHQNGEILV